MKTKEKTKNRLLTFLGATACGVASFLYTGCCQPLQLRYLAAPSEVSGATRAAGRFANCLDATSPTNYEESGKKMGQSLGKLPGDLARVVDSVTGIVGMRPFYGRFLGRNLYEGVNYEFDKLENTEKNWAKYSLIHVPNSLVNVGESFGKVTSDFIDSFVQVPNMLVALPLTCNTKVKEKFFETGELGKVSQADKRRVVADGIGDVVKVPLKTGIYLISNSEGVPDSYKYLWDNVRQWAGINVDNKLESKFKGLNGELNRGRVFVNCLPIVNKPLDVVLWGTRYMYMEGKSRHRLVADTIEDSISAPGLNDLKWYDGKNNPKLMPGVVKDGLFNPAKSVILEALGAAKAAVSLGGSGGGDGVAGGGRGVGGRGGGSGGGN